MATFFKVPFNFGSENYYIEAKVPTAASSSNNIICCVDVSGSMSGSPIRNVCQVLRNIYKQTKIEYPLFTYNVVADTTRTIKSIESRDLNADGGTSFSSIFNAIKNHLVKNQKSTTFIFMTDGDATDSRDELKKSIQMLKLALSVLPKTITIVFHVIGFGRVKNEFLEQIRTFGNKEGLFRYSTKSEELQDNFNDMFEYAMSAREFTMVLNGKPYESNSNEEKVGFLINDNSLNETIANEIILKSSEGETKLSLEKLDNPRPIHIVRALNLISPDDAESVNKIRTYLNTIPPNGNADFLEKLEVEQMKKEIEDRMMEYTKLFTEIKIGQVPEQVQLRLNALRHDATFANVKRRKLLELRVNKNVDYFRKTDISGILDGYKKSIDQQVWNEIKEQKADWVCVYSQDDIYEMMRKSADNIMCIGILIERNEEAITNPTKGLKLLNISNTLITYDSFIAAMNLAKNSQQNDYGQFSQINDTFCIVGQSREKINAVLPLYINYEHMKRIRILEGIWLGYLYTLDSCGYDKEQEIGLLKLLSDIIMMRTETNRSKQIIDELKKVCSFIITESQGFKTAYGEKTYENFKQSIHGRQIGAYDLSIPLMIGYLKNDLKNILIPVYYEHIRRCLHGKLTTDKNETIETLLYGDESERIKTVSVNPDFSIHKKSEHDPDYVEKTFIDYFHDEMLTPIELIPETVTGKDRKAIKTEADEKFLKAFLNSKNLSVPVVIKNMLKFAEIDNNYVENNLDYEDLRKELLMILYSDHTVPLSVTKANILSTIDRKLQGDRDKLISFNFTPEAIQIITYAMLNAKTLDGFGGLLRKYCPKRNNQVFTELIKNLMKPTDMNENVNNSLNRDKLIALMTNRVGNSFLYNNEMANFCWQPLTDVDINNLEKIVGPEEFRKIEKENLGKEVLHCYRCSYKNNHNGYGNYNPNMHYTFKFSGYRDRH
ncbi:unnamed protein product [Brachionus calyciflorus]|uniref:VWFA domain-containing protein n=1 Tax=Brachionus calyciflorus TaxID=104777 RepID=A0A814E4V2_9BILA|nr:unnamed protein product [Brachionus calyciflorus]